MIGIVGLGAACMVAQRDFDENVLRMQSSRDLLKNELKKRIPSVLFNGSSEYCVSAYYDQYYIFELLQITSTTGVALHHNYLIASRIVVTALTLHI